MLFLPSMASFSDLLSLSANGVRLTVRAKPGSSRAREPRIVPTGDKERALEIAVAAAPEDGKANKAILKALAQELGLKKAQFSIKTGLTSRLKQIEIAGPPQELQAQLTAWLSKIAS